ncbi:ABC transporter ATP-binding protein [Saccharopolyspora sp. K220]|uniref:ABC transporter ATP-binding protein n=1 Tax=Saccharopolyspora soli TaxID=2926618 RepID=UPI001F55D16E|nr:ABC transporter ATP-binding protein [Saccharopolyspora soli]MCI2417398.1 ABC transporter ATP-binding protein [Saccharopolyspora soli]
MAVARLTGSGGGAPPAASAFPQMLALSNVSKRFTVDDREFVAVTDVNLDIAAGEFVCVVGPSGCGKSTLLMMMAGLLAPSSGRIEMAGTEVTSPAPSRGVVFQEGGVLPWRTVLRNVTYGLELQGSGTRSERIGRAREYLRMVGLADFENRLPKELSGGMRQRLAIAQSLVCDPQVLLMDEPFGALDAFTRESLQLALLDIWENQRTTVCFVTHSVDEAVILADRIVVMAARPGRVAMEVSVPLARPRTAEVRATEEFQKIRQVVWQAMNDQSVVGSDE